MLRRKPEPGDSSQAEAGASTDESLPEFTLQTAQQSPVPVLIAVPHAGRRYPESLRAQMRRPDYCALRLEDRHVDRLAREIARQTGAALLVAHAPRAMIDLNRSLDDMDWEMVAGGRPKKQAHSTPSRRARGGLGLVPRRLPGLGEIWNRQLKHDELQDRIDRVHRPYHRVLAQSLETLRDRWGAALLIDLHSMPPIGGRHAAGRRPEFVVGDRFGASCDGMLVANTFRYFAQAGKPVAHNRPYAGGYVLDRHAQPVRSIYAMQIEVCRSAYLDRKLDEPSPRLAAVARTLAGLVRALADDVAALARETHPPMAAE